MKSNSYKKIKKLIKEKFHNEDAPTNAVGTGFIAGAVPGESPPINTKRRKKIIKMRRSLPKLPKV